MEKEKWKKKAKTIISILIFTQYTKPLSRCMQNLKKLAQMEQIYLLERKNQRTNGPVNAHLISWPSKAQNLENIW